MKQKPLAIKLLRKLINEQYHSVYPFAALIGAQPQNVYTWQRIPAKYCLSIEKALNGAITRYEMRPDVFGEGPEGEKV